MKHFLPVTITIIIMVCLSACSSDPKETDSDAVRILDSWSPFRSFQPYPYNGLPIRFTAKNDNIRFTIHACDGYLYAPSYEDTADGTELTIGNDEIVYWSCYPYEGEIGESWYGETTFLEVIFMEEEAYTGYAVIQINNPENSGRFSGQILKCSEFLRTNGTCQEISIEWLQSEMKKIEQDARP